MRTETIHICKFDELSDDAKQSAIDNWRARGFGYDGHDEFFMSLNAFAHAIGIKITDHSISSWGHSYIDWGSMVTGHKHPQWLSEIEHLRGLRLRTWLINNWLPLFESKKYFAGRRRFTHRYSNFQMELCCPFTGVCWDMDLIDPILAFIKAPNDHTSIDQIIDECMASLVSAWVTDMEWQDSDEYIAEILEANEYDFTASGELHQ